MMRATQIIAQLDDIPAVHAGMIALTFAFAAAFNIGFFVVLITAHATLDGFRLFFFQHHTLRSTLAQVFVRHSLDGGLLLLSVSAILSLPLLTALLPAGSILRATLAMLRMFGIVVPRVFLLHPPATLHRHGRFMLFLCSTAIIVLAINLSVGHPAVLWQLLRSSFVIVS